MSKMTNFSWKSWINIFQKNILPAQCPSRQEYSAEQKPSRLQCQVQPEKKPMPIQTKLDF